MSVAPKPRLQSWRPSPLKRATPPEALDEAAQSLQTFVRGLQARLYRLVTREARILWSAPQPIHSTGTGQINRAWRFAHHKTELWCTIDEESQRALLSLILRGTPSRAFTALERGILAESVCRLLRTDGEAEHELPVEEPRARPAGGFWRCVVDVVPAATQAFVLEFFTARINPQPALAGPKAHIGPVPLMLEAMLPTITVSMGELLEWKSGDLVNLRVKPDDLVASLYIQGYPLARARLGAVWGERTLQISALTILES